ncbi:hypothetical protein BJY14_007699 [Actinomadura luteofluorescens]|uniref:Uncharacterized protein n=1 Tax=Actinomadura luteofluorescens TaxID=46163 RepID=A0A7Y9EPU0_9ACTN|nr:hypothetical protein [Actinomadura luteofluorescens]NYD51716.1 hypothetical protein [Actinomadura luteofluorescens]
MSGAGPRQRREPAGKTRKTYYLAADTVAALDEAVERIRSALGGRVDRHEAIGAIITAGAAQTDQIVAALRAELLRDLAPGEGGQ